MNGPVSKIKMFDVQSIELIFSKYSTAQTLNG